MATHYATLVSVSADRHADTPLQARAPAPLKAEAQRVLRAHRRDMRGFVVACLTALTADPDRFLDQLDQHWPAQKPRGRPRRSPIAADT